jgi:hypothetical protein
MNTGMLNCLSRLTGSQSSQPHLQAAIPVSVPVEAAGTKWAGAISKVKVGAIFGSHGSFVGSYNSFFFLRSLGPPGAGRYKVCGCAANGARPDRLQIEKQQMLRNTQQ